MGDGVLIEFASAVNAVKAALEIAGGHGRGQRLLGTRTGASCCASASISATSSARARISMATASTSRRGWRRWLNRAASASRPRCTTKCEARSDHAFEDMGEVELKNIAKPVRVFRLGGSCLPTLSEPSPPCRQTVDRRPAVHQYERRSRAAIFLRRHHRGHHHRAVALAFAVRHRPQLVVSISRQSR